jgi:hypothetical protein
MKNRRSLSYKKEFIYIQIKNIDTIKPMATRCGPRNCTTIINVKERSHHIQRSKAITTLNKYEYSLGSLFSSNDSR